MTTLGGSLYDDLGLTSAATPEEIQTTYDALARQFGPDQFAGADAAAQAAGAEKWSKVTYAYGVLSNPDLRQQYNGSKRSVAPTTEDQHLPQPLALDSSQCSRCASSPAIEITFRRGVGMLFLRRRFRYTTRVCRDCGIEMFRRIQNQTMVSGWWGIISFFTNFYYISENFSAYRQLRALPEPVHREGNYDVPRSKPANPGRPLLTRLGVWITAGAVVIGALLFHQNTQSHPNTIAGLSHNYQVGACVRSKGTFIYGMVGCGSHHFGKIVAITTAFDRCPSSTTVYFTEKVTDPEPGRVVCVDTGE